MAGKGGFMGSFAYGFAQTADPILKAKGIAEADADARIREKVASVEPMAELNKRDQENKTAAAIALKKAETDSNIQTFQQLMGQQAAPVNNLTNTVSNPAATITTPSMSPTNNGPNPFTPTAEATPAQPVDINATYDKIHKGSMIATVGDLMGHKGIAAAGNQMVSDAKNDLEKSDKLKKANVDEVTAADGVNVPDFITKKKLH